MKEEYSSSAIHYIKLLMTWKKQFIVITLLAIGASALFSSAWFIKPRYKSKATVYPANVEPYSEESTTEQVLQVFQSNEIRNAVIQKFNLAKHYGVDTTGKEAQANLIGTYQFFVSISKTQFESIEIEVTDTDPQLACDMVNEIVLQLDKKVTSMHNLKSLEVKQMIEMQMKNKERQLDSMGAYLQEIRSKYQILDYNIQTEEVTKGYMVALNNGKGGQGMKDIDQLYRNLAEKGGDYYRTKVAYDGVLNGYNLVRNDYDNVMKELSKKFTYTYSVTTPTPADKKSYPVRWLIVVISVVSANMFLFFAIIAMEYKRRFNLK